MLFLESTKLWHEPALRRSFLLACSTLDSWASPCLKDLLRIMRLEVEGDWSGVGKSRSRGHDVVTWSLSTVVVVGIAVDSGVLFGSSSKDHEILGKAGSSWHSAMSRKTSSSTNAEQGRSSSDFRRRFEHRSSASLAGKELLVLTVGESGMGETTQCILGPWETMTALAEEKVC